MRTCTLAALLAVIITTVALAAQPTSAAFPGVNGRIAFQSDRDGKLEIYVMDADGSGQTNLTNHADVDGEPAWSADGSMLAFNSAPSHSPNADIYSINADGSGRTNLTNHPSQDFLPAHDFHSTWAPDGSNVAFTTNRDFNFEVYLMNADGTGQTNLTNSPGSSDSQPSWSPDGSEIAFVTDRLGFPFFEIYVMDADGNNQVSVMSSLGFVAAPDWSPDGSKIAFQAYAGPYPNGSLDVFVMNANGSGAINLTNDPSNNEAPAWSPDGTKIAFHSDRGASYDIYAMNTDGSDVTQLTNDPGSDRAPSWGPAPPAVGGVGFPAEPLRDSTNGSIAPLVLAAAGLLGIAVLITRRRAQRC